VVLRLYVYTHTFSCLYLTPVQFVSLQDTLEPYFASDKMTVDPWNLWSYWVILLLGFACYFLSGWLRAVLFVLQLPGPPTVPLLGNVLLVHNQPGEL